MAHRAAVFLVGVGKDVGDHEPPAGTQHARDLGERDRRIVHVVQQVHHEGDVERRGREGQFLDAALYDLHVAEAREARARDVEHLGRRVDGHHRAGVRRERGGDAPRPAAQVADLDLGIEQRGQEPEVAGGSEELTAQPVPLVRDVREERLGVALAALQHLLAATPVERHGDRLGEALVHDLPEPLRALVELVDRERVATARAVAARRDPARVGELLEVARDRRLRQGERVAQLDDRQLDPVETREHSPARGVGEQTELGEERRCGRGREAGGGFHPSSRIIEYSAPRFKEDPSIRAARGSPGRAGRPRRRPPAASRPGSTGRRRRRPRAPAGTSARRARRARAAPRAPHRARASARDP